MKMLNPDFDLNTFYWMYAKSDSSEQPSKVTFTVECYYKGCDTPYMLIQASPTHSEYQVTDGRQEGDDTVSDRVYEAVKAHFGFKFMCEDGLMMVVEYANGASGQLHSHPDFGQAIFGMDLEEAYADE